MSAELFGGSTLAGFATFPILQVDYILLDLRKLAAVQRGGSADSSTSNGIMAWTREQQRRTKDARGRPAAERRLPHQPSDARIRGSEVSGS